MEFDVKKFVDFDVCTTAFVDLRDGKRVGCIKCAVLAGMGEENFECEDYEALAAPTIDVTWAEGEDYEVYEESHKFLAISSEFAKLVDKAEEKLFAVARKHNLEDTPIGDIKDFVLEGMKEQGLL